MSYYNHVEQMKDFLNDRLNRGITTFTHKDIVEVTNTNCPHSVLRSLKKYYELDYTDSIRTVKKQDLNKNPKWVNIRFRTYTILKRKENNVEKPSFRRASQNGQLSLIFMGEGFN